MADDSLINAYKAFLNFTQAKKRECFKDFTEGQKDAYQIIPYLLHTSEPKRFSYIEGEVAPAGLYGYKFSEDIKSIGKKYFSSKDRFEDPKSVPSAPIESLSIMGSAGSIAQTEGSDLDYWLCVNDYLSKSKKDLLQKKLSRIEKWCMDELDAEVHFFISTSKTIRENNFGSVDKESCGTALGKLLKEEYYRTSLHVMGKVPIWWLAPYNANNQAYQNIIKKLPSTPNIEADDFIDFGNTRDIPGDEFVGGGMWQLNKGVGSPFKSALKLGLLVEYADDGKPRDLLAQMLKRRMLSNPGDMDKLDPYRMMIERVLEYYKEQGDEKAIYLLERCLFLKMDLKISRWWDSKRESPKRSVRTLVEMVRSWGWSRKDVEKWENFDILPMAELTDFKRSLESYMFTSLQALRAQGEDTDSKAVSPEDFKKMTQRLTTIFNPNPKKTEWFYPPYNKMIRSDVYSIQEEEKGGVVKWNLYTGVIDEEGQLSAGTARKQLKSSKNLSGLCAWMLYNQLMTPSTKLFIKHKRGVPFTGNVRRMSEAYHEHIGKPELPSLDNNAFAKDPVPAKWLIVVNLIPMIEMEEEEEEVATVEESEDTQISEMIAGELSEALTEAGYDEKAEEVATSQNKKDEAFSIGDKELKLRAGRVPASEDPFNAGPDECSIFHELFLIELNTWGEVYAHESSGTHSLAHTIATIVKHSIKQLTNHIDIRCEIGTGPYHSKPVQKRFTALVENMTKGLIHTERDSAVAIFLMNGDYVSIIRQYKDVAVHTHSTLSNAVHHANLEVKGSVEFLFDENLPRLARHYSIYKESAFGENVLHILDGKDGCLIAVVDQTGRYLFDAMEKDDFNVQWPPLFLSLLGAIRQLSEHQKAGKLSILRGKHGADDKLDITKNIFTVFQKIKHKLPRTQMQVTSKEAFEWLQQYSENLDGKIKETNVYKELLAALDVHTKSSGAKPFILSSVQIKNINEDGVYWTPSLQLQLRQTLIRSGRKAQNKG